ncbi:calcium/sodium:proton antiporter [Pseudidiomarina salinarum]|uniref:Calcium/sodium:proton antiporter n=1 Tax=Pseudidiomarina salinarum TaxID=435908 RepID=A0A094L9E0_9GAMM|nr:calcium/sodium antiporter [Pseudidiomarina salinarum]KFZ31433.1 calcium/sodium:proton antiporter [Pseudidiomarina salinarum]RUO70807.1 calcium/sodium antiporter [Pseudidiomarina salinarum]
MLLPVVAIVFGLILLVWSADRFIDGAAATAGHLGMPPLLIGMLIIGFGTSAPELVVSVLASVQGNPALALGNAYGSNITNIALVLGLTAVLAPIAVSSQVLKREMPLLLMVTFVAMFPLLDFQITTLEAWFLLAVFATYFGWSIYQGMRGQTDVMTVEVDVELKAHAMPLKRAIIWLLIGLILLVISSRMLVWGAVDIATALGVSDLVIGLTVVAVGTSLPELASAIAAVRKNEHDLAIGNVIGSNMFNTLAVVGLAGVINPIPLEPLVLYRDWIAIAILTVLLAIFGFRRGRPNRINRVHGAIFILCYIGYTIYLLRTGFLQ